MANSNNIAINSFREMAEIAENYIYMYHTGTYIIVPVYPEILTDTTSVNFTSTQPLARSAPIYSYANSGPRSIQFSFSLHRDFTNQINSNLSNAKPVYPDDYVDLMAKQIQAAALPRYAAASKMVDPPIVAVRIGKEVFIKGVVTGGVTVSYGLPVLRNDKYAKVEIGFTVNEIDPYDAETAIMVGSYRTIGTSLERNQWAISSTGIKTSTRTTV